MMQAGLANAAMSVILFWLHRPLAWWLAADLSARVTWLGLSVFAGGVAYVIALAAFGLRPSKLRLKQ
jgi:peptidoglycan biosynthesis protein MviN/MurJ (putative lipid II flippase)